MLEWSQCESVEREALMEREALKVSGNWVFKETRVPVKALFENLEDGATLEQFLEWFPGVARHQAESVLDFAATSLDLAPA